MSAFISDGNGLNSGRFAGKTTVPKNVGVRYLLTMWNCGWHSNVLEIGKELNIGRLEGDESNLCDVLCSLFDRPFKTSVNEVDQLIRCIEVERNELDFQINNCVMDRKHRHRDHHDSRQACFWHPAGLAKPL